MDTSSLFSEKIMVDRLANLTCNADNIQTISLWLLYHQRVHGDLIALTWLKQVKRESNSTQLINLIYLANDVIQNSRRKAPDFMQRFYKVLEPAFKHCSRLPFPDLDKSIAKVLKVFRDRQVYAEEQIVYLEDIVSGKKTSHNKPSSSAAAVYGRHANNASSNNAEYDAEAVDHTCEELIESLTKLTESALPSSDETMKHSLANYPENVGNPALLDTVRNSEEVAGILAQVNEVQPIASEFCRQIADEILERRNMQDLIGKMVDHVRSSIDNHDKTLKKLKRAEERLKVELNEVQRACESLPDLSDMPSSKLPTVESLFHRRST